MMEAQTPKLMGGKSRQMKKQINSSIVEVLNKRKKAGENCSICNEKPANTIFEKCLHGGLCAECAVNMYILNDKKCSFCREVCAG